jgi:hypothetical protein
MPGGNIEKPLTASLMKRLVRGFEFIAQWVLFQKFSNLLN